MRRSSSPKAARSPASGGRDPLDIGAAVDRLRALIAFDAGNGPRQGIPQRGYYLNILV